jgi:hypothetical protein
MIWRLLWILTQALYGVVLFVPYAVTWLFVSAEAANSFPGWWLCKAGQHDCVAAKDGAMRCTRCRYWTYPYYCG